MEGIKDTLLEDRETHSKGKLIVFAKVDEGLNKDSSDGNKEEGES